MSRLVFLCAAFCFLFCYAGRSEAIPCPRHNITTYSYVMPSTLQILFTYQGHILHLAEDNSVFCSADGGKSWDRPKLANPRVSFGAVRRIVVSPDHKIVLYVGHASAKNSIWVSRDGGLTIESSVIAPDHLTNFKFHPNQAGWVLAISRPGCRDQLTCSHDLYFSADGGVSWAMIRKYVIDVAWHEGPTKASPQNLVVWESAIKSGNIYFNGPKQVSKSDTFFRDDETVIKQDVVGFLALQSHILIAREGPLVKGRRSFELHSSSNGGDTFQRVRFSEDLSEQSYAILDVSEGSSFIGVSHEFSNYVNVYAGDTLDQDFTLSLKNVVAGRGVDFRPFYGIEGVYLANIWNTVTNGRGSRATTVISYDKGGEWQQVTTHPDQTGAKLNILGPVEEFGGFYSRKEAVGIMFASGNVGDSLSTNPRDHDMFLTRDAGWTWKQIANGSHTYEIGSKGAIIIAAKDEEPTSSFDYSLTEGTEWFSCPLLKTQGIKVDIENIFTDPELSSRHFIVYGDIPSTGEAVISVVDFSGVHQRICDDNDYEVWEPSDRDGDECILGRRVAYKRRKQTASCFLPKDFHVDGKVVSNCPCTAENYVCDFCYIRLNAKHECVFDKQNPNCRAFDPNVVLNQTCLHGEKSYVRTQGYRKVPGDTCDPRLAGSVDLMPVNVSCSFWPDIIPSSPGGWFAFVGLFAVLIGLGITWYCAGTNESCRAGLAKVIPEKFLPDRRAVLPNAQYQQLNSAPFDGEAIDEDAREIHTDESDASEALQSS